VLRRGSSPTDRKKYLRVFWMSISFVLYVQRSTAPTYDAFDSLDLSQPMGEEMVCLLCMMVVALYKVTKHKRHKYSRKKMIINTP